MEAFLDPAEAELTEITGGIPEAGVIWSDLYGNPKGPLFKETFFKTQVDCLPTATRTCKWPALWRLHLQMGFATTEPWLALDWLSKAEGVASEHRTGQSISL